MSFAVLANNQSIKVNGAVSASSSAVSATLYTAPSNGYAIVQVSINEFAGSPVRISVGGFPITTYNEVDNVFQGQFDGSSAGVALIQSIYLGPSQSISFSNNSGAGTVYVTGVSFINSPS